MITQVSIKNFKKFEHAGYELNASTTLFVGPNNGGKTTALQAIALWSSCIQIWRDKKGSSDKSKSITKRPGAPIVQTEVYATPIGDLKLLWFKAITQDEKSARRAIHITVFGTTQGIPWEYGIELTYHSPEMIYCKPLDYRKSIPEDVDNVFHLPPLSGVQIQEPKMELGAQRHIIGEGRPGEVLRNLLLQVQHKGKWEELTEIIFNVFQVKLQEIPFNPSTDKNIRVYYRFDSTKSGKGKELEIASGGSGFLQFLLLAAYVYTHENAILLVDEPDSHMHVMLQQGMYNWLKETANKNNSQLLVTTHSEVIINSTSADDIYAVFSNSPTKLVEAKNKKHLNDALKKVSTVEILNAQEKKYILFAEGDTDLRLLARWATVLHHCSRASLLDVFFSPTKNDQSTAAIEKFTSLKLIEPDLKGLFIRDKVQKITEDYPKGLDITYLSRTEIENYLIVPDALKRYIEKELGPIHAEAAQHYLTEHLAPALFKDPLKNDFNGKGSEFLEKFFHHIGYKLNKGNYCEIASVMTPDEIHSDIKNILDKIAKIYTSTLKSHES